jgi:hypothetical protein
VYFIEREFSVHQNNFWDVLVYKSQTKYKIFDLLRERR